MKKPIDIIIKSWNAVEYTQLAIKSIKENTGIPYRIIVVDDGSTKNTLEILEKIPNIELIKHNKNLGAAWTANTGYKIVKSDYFVLMDSDIVVTHGWLKYLLSYTNDSSIGILCPIRYSNKYLYPHSNVSSRTYWEKIRQEKLTPEIALSKFTKGSTLEKFSNDFIQFNKLKDEFVVAPPGFVSSSCILLNRKAVNEIGGITDLNFTSYGEDVDLCWRMGRAGYKIIRTNKVYVHHFEHSSVISNKVNYKKMMDNSNLLLYKKWANVFESEVENIKRSDPNFNEADYPFIKLFTEIKTKGHGKNF